ncbi:MAG: YHS domain-containing protein [Kiloniellaceae bacterium]
MKVCDPVCGKEIGLADVVASEDHEGWAYFFCSEPCHRRFMAAPERYARALDDADCTTSAEHEN